MCIMLTISLTKNKFNIYIATAVAMMQQCLLSYISIQYFFTLTPELPLWNSIAFKYQLILIQFN